MGLDKRSPFRTAILAGAAALALPCLGQRPGVTLYSESAFLGMSPGAGVFPLRIHIENTGRSTSGVVEVEAGAYRMSYPVELPTGSRKSFLAYVSIEYYDPPRIVFKGEREYLEHRFRTERHSSAQIAVASIAERPGAITFFKRLNWTAQSTQQQVGDVYCKPGELPDRAIGYDSIAMVVLGEGSERMKDTEVRALKLWMLTGGTIVLFGGAANPVLQDERWAELIPVREASPQSRALPREFRDYGTNGLPSGPVSVIDGKLAPGCEEVRLGRSRLFAVRRVGFGRLVYCPFDLTEQPLRIWEGRARLLDHKLGVRSAGHVRTRLLAQFLPPVRDTMGYFPPGYGGSYGGVYVSIGSEGPTPSNPFSARAPDAGIVAGILIAYLVVGVPVNFLLVRRKGRGELAWFTTPILSLGFAAAFFWFARDLYSAQLSVSEKGILVVDESLPEGSYVGHCAVYFPRGGRYDLGLESVEHVSPAKSGSDHYFYTPYSRRQGTDTFEAMNAFDVGEVRIPGFEAGNLSFHEFALFRSVPGRRWLETKLSRTGRVDRPLIGTVTNKSPFPMRGASLFFKSRRFEIGDLAPGAAMNIAKDKSWSVPAHGATESDPSFLPPGRAVVRAEVADFRPGPRIGKFVRSGIPILVYSYHGVEEAGQ